MAAKSDAPHEDVDAHPFSDWPALESEVLGVLEDEVAEVEDGAQPVVPWKIDEMSHGTNNQMYGSLLVRRKMRGLLDTEDSGASKGRLIHELDPVKYYRAKA